MHGYLPVACMASRNVCAGSRLNSSQRFMNSSTVGVPLAQAMRSMTLGWLTFRCRATARIERLRSSFFHAASMACMSLRSVADHSLAVRGMEGILAMVERVSNLTAVSLDKMVATATIKDMMVENTTTLTAGQIAIEYLARTTAAKGMTREALASKLGVARQTVTARFRKRDMSIDDFIDTAQAIGTDPAQVIADAMQIKNTALAGKEE